MIQSQQGHQSLCTTKFLLKKYLPTHLPIPIDPSSELILVCASQDILSHHEPIIFHHIRQTKNKKSNRRIPTQEIQISLFID